MKYIKFLKIFIFLSSFFLIGCQSNEFLIKRKYRSGYYLNSPAPAIFRNNKCEQSPPGEAPYHSQIKKEKRDISNSKVTEFLTQIKLKGDSLNKRSSENNEPITYNNNLESQYFDKDNNKSIKKNLETDI